MNRARPRDTRPAASYPQFSLAVDLLETFMAEGAWALFEARHKDDPADCGHPYRATVFWPVTLRDGKERLYPFVRARFGGSAFECHSPLFFKRRENEQYAGTAWFTSQYAIRDANLPTLKDCGNEETWREAWRRNGVPRRVTQDMALQRNSYLTRVRSLVCVGTQTPYGEIVLCIESTRVDGFSDEHLTRHARNRYGDIACMLAQIPKRVSDRSDFWTWVLNEVAAWPFWVVVTTTLPAATWLATRFIDPGQLKSVWRFLPVAHPLALVLALSMMPHSHREWEDSPSERRITKFIERWRLTWICLLVSQLGLAARALRAEVAAVYETVLHFVIPLSVTGAAYFIFSSYLCLTRFPQNQRPSNFQAVEQAVSVPSSIMVGAFVIFGLSLVKEPFLWVCPASITLGVALCLLVGRFDSHLIGTPRSLVAMLYLGAFLYPLSCMLASMDRFVSNDASFAAVREKLGSVLQPALDLSYLVSLPLTAVLFAVVCWSIRGRALERYFANVERVSGVVPYATLRDAFKALRAAKRAAK